jgi:hypothetical protein
MPLQTHFARRRRLMKPRGELNRCKIGRLWRLNAAGGSAAAGFEAQRAAQVSWGRRVAGSDAAKYGVAGSNVCCFLSRRGIKSIAAHTAPQRCRGGNPGRCRGGAHTHEESGGCAGHRYGGRMAMRMRIPVRQWGHRRGACRSPVAASFRHWAAVGSSSVTGLDSSLRHSASFSLRKRLASHPK